MTCSDPSSLMSRRRRLPQNRHKVVYRRCRVFNNGCVRLGWNGMQTLAPSRGSDRSWDLKDTVS